MQASAHLPQTPKTFSTPVPAYYHGYSDKHRNHPDPKHSWGHLQILSLLPVHLLLGLLTSQATSLHSPVFSDCLLAPQWRAPLPATRGRGKGEGGGVWPCTGQGKNKDEEKRNTLATSMVGCHRLRVVGGLWTLCMGEGSGERAAIVLVELSDQTKQGYFPKGTADEGRRVRAGAAAGGRGSLRWRREAGWS